VTISQGDIVIAPFRFTDLDRYRARPVLVVSHAETYGATQHIIGVMVTLAADSAWPLDVPVKDCVAANLREGSIVRMKLFTIAQDVVGPKIGRIDEATLTEVRATLRAVLA
jgi:mRNA-degrading endonuclease toxin of MazEF toxin-antitoxin module